MEIMPVIKYSLKGIKTKQNIFPNIAVGKVSNFTIVTKSSKKIPGKIDKNVKEASFAKGILVKKQYLIMMNGEAFAQFK